MSTAQEQATIAESSSELQETPDEFVYVEGYEYEDTAAAAKIGCGCFRGLCLRWRGSSNIPHRYVLYEEEQEAARDEGWVTKKLHKVKLLSEILEGPKWKNFIRRLRLKDHGINKKWRMQYQYDPKSYALNFDDGEEKEDQNGAYVGFSARFADPMGVNKSELR